MSVFKNIINNATRNLHYISTEEGARKVGNAFQAIVMDTHDVLKQIKQLQKQDMNKLGIVVGLLATCEFRDTLSAMSDIIKDFETMNDITHLSPKTEVEEEKTEKPVLGSAFADPNVKVVGSAFI